MRRLQKIVFDDAPFEPITDEELEEANEMLKLLEQNGAVCITDPTHIKKNILDNIKNHPENLLEYNGEIPFDEFYQRLRNGEYDDL